MHVRHPSHYSTPTTSLIHSVGKRAYELCLLSPRWHNLRNYRWSQQIVKSYWKARNRKFLWQNSVCLGSLLTMRSITIDEALSLLRALSATLVHTWYLYILVHWHIIEVCKKYTKKCVNSQQNSQNRPKLCFFCPKKGTGIKKCTTNMSSGYIVN